MKVTVVCVGKLKEKYWRDAIAEYSKRLSRYMKLEIIELADEKAPENMSDAQAAEVKEREGQRILKNVKDDAFAVALAVEGKMLSSEELWRREPYRVHHRRLSGAFPCGDAARGLCTQLFQNDISAPDDARGFIGADLPLGADSAQRAIS